MEAFVPSAAVILRHQRSVVNADRSRNVRQLRAVTPRCSLVGPLSTATTIAAGVTVAAADGSNSAPFWLPVAWFACGPGLIVFNTLMLVRIVISWYPKINFIKPPWSLIVIPTEPLLKATRQVIKPTGGVDISPIVWLFIGSFVREITVGPQGLLTLLQAKYS